MFACPSHCLFLTHHVDHVRVIGPAEELKQFMQYVEKTMLGKVSDQIEIGVGYEHLGDEKHRQPDGWWTKSNPKRARWTPLDDLKSDLSP